MEKPVIILGGSIWGSLLAWRLKEALPNINFQLYEESSSLGEHQSCSFRESDCSREAMNWIRPLVSQTWGQHHIKFKKFEKWITNPYHLIDPKQLHKKVSARLGDSLHLNNLMTLEYALQKGAFVIDARNVCQYKKQGFRKFLGLTVELTEEHHLIAPVIIDKNVEQKECSRHLYYLPLSPTRLLIKDFWLSSFKRIDMDEMRQSLLETIKSRGWKISKVVKEESGSALIPLTAPFIRQEGRVISLAGLFHDITGCNIPVATRLIDQMVSSSFRFGEIREIVNNFRRDYEKDRKFFRYLNRQIIEEKNESIFEAIYEQSYPVLERFSRGRLDFLDRSKIAFGKSAYTPSGIVNMLLPYAFYPKVQASSIR
jgi:lycopene beta-cyclase